MAAAAHFGGCFGRNRPISVAVLAVSVPFSAGIWPSRHESKKKKGGRVGESDAGCCVGLRCGNLGAALVLSRFQVYREIGIEVLYIDSAAKSLVGFSPIDLPTWERRIFSFLKKNMV